MQVRLPVVESGEEKAQGRHLHDPVPDALVEGGCLVVVGQAGLGELHRADAAQQVLIHLLRAVEELQAV